MPAQKNLFAVYWSRRSYNSIRKTEDNFIALGLPQELDNKTMLLKTPHTFRTQRNKSHNDNEHFQGFCQQQVVHAPVDAFISTVHIGNIKVKESFKKKLGIVCLIFYVYVHTYVCGYPVFSSLIRDIQPTELLMNISKWILATTLSISPISGIPQLLILNSLGWISLAQLLKPLYNLALLSLALSWPLTLMTSLLSFPYFSSFSHGPPALSACNVQSGLFQTPPPHVFYPYYNKEQAYPHFIFFIHLLPT